MILSRELKDFVYFLLKKLSFALSLAMALVFPAVAQSPGVIGELFASETSAHGPVLLAGAGMEVSSGSQLTAGKSVATLRLARGGEVRICPESGISVSAVQNGPQTPGTDRELMLAMDAGSVELDYPLNDLADTLITPDFKLMLAGSLVTRAAAGEATLSFMLPEDDAEATE